MHARIFLSAAIAVGGLGYVANAQTAAERTENAAQNAAQRTGDALNRTGEAIRNTGDRLTGATTNPSAMASDAEDIRETLAEVTNAALTQGAFDDLVERFVDADRNRLGIGGFTEQAHPELDGVIAQIRNDWKAKYNQDFKSPDKEDVFTSSFVTIKEGEIGDSARLATERQTGLNTTPGATGTTGTPRTGAADPVRPAPAGDAGRIAGGDTNRDPGRNIASVTVAAGAGGRSLNVPMIHELPDAWRIDIPDNYSAQALHQNLVKHLKEVSEMKDRWPADPNEAYRQVTRHVLMAVMNDGNTGSSGALSPSMEGTTPGSSTPGSMTPGSSTPGSSTPGSSTPGSSTPGSLTPGSSTPGSTGGQ